jgi:hypothetical protein
VRHVSRRPASSREGICRNLTFYVRNLHHIGLSDTLIVNKMAWQDLIERIHDLSDLELATLLCLIAKEHCIVETDGRSLNDLEQELQLVRSLSIIAVLPG